MFNVYASIAPHQPVKVKENIYDERTENEGNPKICLKIHFRQRHGFTDKMSVLKPLRTQGKGTRRKLNGSIYCGI